MYNYFNHAILELRKYIAPWEGDTWGYRAHELEGVHMVSQKVVIKNPTGLHLRPAGILCKEAMQFKSLITFTFRDNTANAKSVLSVLGACVKCGDEIEFVCEGEDEAEALQALVAAVESGLGE